MILIYLVANPKMVMFDATDLLRSPGNVDALVSDVNSLIQSLSSSYVKLAEADTDGALA